MRRLAIMLVLVPLAAACGGTVQKDATDAPTARGGLFLARPAGLAGPLDAYDTRRLTSRFRLSAGLAAADRSAYFALAGGKLSRFDPKSGVRTRTYRVGAGWALAAVSANGHWVALTRGETSVRVVDARAGRIERDIALRGDFLVETVAADGSFLFLQQSYTDGSYAVRGYDLAAGQLLPGSLATKGETVHMQGVAAGTVASPDGRWLLTLYVDTKRNAAFVHALNLFDRFPLCIDMPPCKKCTVAVLRRWALALGPDGRTLYAANPALGRVAEVHLPTSRVLLQARFRADPGDGEPRATVSPDGSRFLFTNGERLWAYDTHRGFAQPVGTQGGAIADLAVSRDGARVLLARPGKTPLALEL